MLVRLDEIPGVEASRVDWTGRRFLLTLQPGSDPDVVAERAAGALGADTLILDDAETLACVDAYRDGEAWMRSGQTLQLSRHEAKVLAERFGGEAAEELGLSPDETRKLVDLFEAELTRTFERRHAGKGGVPSPEELEGAVDRILDSSRRLLNAEQQAGLETYLEQFGAPRGP